MTRRWIVLASLSLMVGCGMDSVNLVDSSDWVDCSEQPHLTLVADETSDLVVTDCFVSKKATTSPR